MKLLLISNSTLYGSGYLDHCAGPIRQLFEGAGPVAFVPYAVFDRDAYASKVRARFEALGLTLESVHSAADPREAVRRAGAIFIGGGNTFRLLDALWRHDLIDPIRRRVNAGIPYVGSSAGSNVACPSIRTTNDMPIVQPPTFAALNLVPFNINAHYLDPVEGSTHMGETRAQRIAEFHEENPQPVVGLREGSWLVVEGGSVRLDGAAAARIFLRDQPAGEVSPGADLSWLLRGDG